MTNKNKQLLIVAGISALVSAGMIYASYNTKMIFNQVGLGSKIN